MHQLSLRGRNMFLLYSFTAWQFSIRQLFSTGTFHSRQRFHCIENNGNCLFLCFWALRSWVMRSWVRGIGSDETSKPNIFSDHSSVKLLSKLPPATSVGRHGKKRARDTKPWNHSRPLAQRPTASKPQKWLNTKLGGCPATYCIQEPWMLDPQKLNPTIPNSHHLLTLKNNKTTPVYPTLHTPQTRKPSNPCPTSDPECIGPGWFVLPSCPRRRHVRGRAMCYLPRTSNSPWLRNSP